jgi:prepilin-type N-terminal cleavage/methylation domain-containing protein
MRHLKTKGFTLVELLVTIGIIGVLTGILLPALSKAQRSARELASQSDLRQMLLGYTMYQQDNHGSVLWGYTPAAVNGLTITVTDPISGQTFGSPIADRYPWRLLPYVANIWRIIHSHEEVPPIPEAGDSASTAFLKAYTLSLNPTYGINSVFVGGDANFGGFNGQQPNTGSYIVFKASEVRHSSQLIVFTDCRCYNVPNLIYQGLYSVTPPYAGGLQWTFTNAQFQFTHPYSAIGVPQGWCSQRVVVGFFDGHVDTMLPNELEDMRLWANWADSPDYDYTN